MKAIYPTLLAIILVTPVTGWAGGSEGGGASIVCKREPTSYDSSMIGSVALLDLQETIDAHQRGKSKFIIPIRHGLDAELQFAAAAKRLNAVANLRLSDGTGVAEEKKQLESNMDIGVGMKIAAPADTGKGRAIFLPTDCELGAIGYRQSDGTLAISGPVYEKLNPTHRAAFWMHEAIYSLVLKLTGKPLPPETGTENIRALVALLFASNSTPDEINAAFRKLGLPAELEKSGDKRDALYTLADVFDLKANLRYQNGGGRTEYVTVDSTSNECIAHAFQDLDEARMDPAIRQLVRKIRAKGKADYLELHYDFSSIYRGWISQQTALETKLQLFAEKDNSFHKAAGPETDLGIKSDWHGLSSGINAVKDKKPAFDELLQRGGCSFSKEKLASLLQKASGEQTEGKGTEQNDVSASVSTDAQ